MTLKRNLAFSSVDHIKKAILKYSQNSSFARHGTHKNARIFSEYIIYTMSHFILNAKMILGRTENHLSLMIVRCHGDVPMLFQAVSEKGGSEVQIN